MKKPKVIIIQGTIPHYRRALLEGLAEFCDLIVIHTGQKNEKKTNYKELIFEKRHFFGFRIITSLKKTLLSSAPDFIIGMPDLHWINIIYLSYSYPNREKWVWWGLDTGRNFFSTELKKIIFQFHNKFLFYSDTALKNFSNSWNPDALKKVARNTIAVPHNDFIPLPRNHNIFLAVGTLNHRKRHDLLLVQYFKYCKLCKSPLPLVLIGSGPELSKLENICKTSKYSKNVKFVPHLDADSKILADYYKRAVCCFSLGQAGLSILQSFGFSRPFVAFNNAISGGELENIKHGYNGLKVKEENEVSKVLLRLHADRPMVLQLCRNAFNYYHQEASLENLLNQFKYVLMESKK